MENRIITLLEMFIFILTIGSWIFIHQSWINFLFLAIGIVVVVCLERLRR